MADLEAPRESDANVFCAGDVVDAFIDQLVPLLDKGDIIIDGGNPTTQTLTVVLLNLRRKASYT